MSSVDDSGAHRVPPHDPALDDPCPPLDAIRGRDWLRLWRWHVRKYPDWWAEHNRGIDDEARALCVQAAALTGHVPKRFLFALRRGGDGITRHDVRIHGLSVQIVTKTSKDNPPSADREIEVWETLLRVIDDVEAARSDACDGFSRHPDMPREILIASWNHDGHRYYACGEGASSSLRDSRPRSFRSLGGLAALLHIPSLAAIAQRLAEACSGPVVQTTAAAAAVGVVATASIAPPHHTPAEAGTPPASQQRRPAPSSSAQQRPGPELVSAKRPTPAAAQPPGSSSASPTPDLSSAPGSGPGSGPDPTPATSPSPEDSTPAPSSAPETPRQDSPTPKRADPDQGKPSKPKEAKKAKPPKPPKPPKPGKTKDGKPPSDGDRGKGKVKKGD